MKHTRKHLAILLAAILLLGLAACGNTETNNTTTTNADSTEDPMPFVQTIVLYADFSGGSERAEELELIKEEVFETEDEVTIQLLAKSLSEWSGLDFTLNSATIDGSSAYVDWAAASTLVAGLDDREQKEDFHFFDAVSLNWFMMDSLATTIKGNFSEVTEVYYATDGKPLVFEEQPGLTELPVDQPYEGSAFFAAHADGRGDLIEMTQEQAEFILAEALGERVTKEAPIEFIRKIEDGGKEYYTFALGNTGPYFAVDMEGELYDYDMVNGEYEPFAYG